MLKRKLVRILIILICIFTFVMVNIPGSKVEAATDADMYNNGNFEFTTTDTAATTNTTWETIGFTVRRDISHGNPLKDNKYAIFMIRSNQRIEGPTGPDGKKEVTFYLTKKQVNDSLKGTDLETIKDNDDLYINGIIEVKNGTKPQDTYYTLDGIKNAENWIDNTTFEQRFDVHIYYRAGEPEYPVKITYQLYQSGSYITDGSTYYKNEDQNSTDPILFKTHDNIKVTHKNIPKSRTSGKDTYYLYRVYYQNLPSKKVLGNRKLSSHPLLDEAQYNSDLAYIRNRTFTIQSADEDESL
ncbi:MAG: hypothetical protein ACK5JH_13450, partial [Anaerocolumna sp.]